MVDASPKSRSPVHIRLVARASVVSLLIAAITLLLANVQQPSIFTAALKLIFLSASAVGVFALVLWVVFSGFHFMFSKREEPESTLDLF